ncbi:hypothetical protein KBP30_40230 [Streptomyces sp. Go40/10]|uniref:hypothetical protein n=1 Tax=Streptomyces sp. Go40/10 TaxID=2825844 RepID=UPI001E5EBB45|nr:hypothetical protein [Streptomyces sp. Go40/10]UFR06999.1 hypothetical protein KBP30_40230 [Streptomyces sp. Go40/10]
MAVGFTSGQRKVRIRRDEDGRIVGADGEDQEQDGADAATESALLHLLHLGRRLRQHPESAGVPVGRRASLRTGGVEAGG